jgi:hypothetical protein
MNPVLATGMLHVPNLVGYRIGGALPGIDTYLPPISRTAWQNVSTPA